MTLSSRSRVTILLILSHAAAVGAGLYLYRDLPSADSGKQDVLDGTASERVLDCSEIQQEGRSDRARTRSQAEIMAGKTSVHQKAWKLLAYDKLPRPERLKAGAVILRQWIRDDWQAALETVMHETPDDFVLLEEFHDVFVREPEAVWSLIEKQPYGVMTCKIRDHWLIALGREDPATLLQLAEKLPASGKAALTDLLNRESR